MITKLLIANRGEIASRIIRTAREMDIATVAIFSDADRLAPYVAQADESVHLPGTAPADTYLRGDLVLAAAATVGADAIHPGYGFLSENADFAAACAKATVTFVGPSPHAISAMGSKIAAKEMMLAAGVPVLPGVTVDAGQDADPDNLCKAAADIGFPILVKAAFGGGGRGMRIVADESELLEAVTGARREAASAFGDGTVFLERFVESPRHIEVQIFGDSHGTVVHLGERECSIQRRYQKIIEEAPSTAVDETLRAELGRAAVAAGKALSYEGAGTVEFVMAPDGSFYFLEVNTRLQVEHPVTELVTGIDLVRAQLLVAAGEPLPPEMLDTRPTGHAVEVRLYAEDVAGGFIPVSGTLDILEFPELPGVRVDAGFASGSTVSTFYDPMLAKIIGYGATRDEACRRVARALRETRVHGVTTNRDLLVAVLCEPEFRAGAIDTGYLQRHDPSALLASGEVAAQTHAVVAAIAAQAQRRQLTPILPGLPSGWRTLPSNDQIVEYEIGADIVQVRYRFGRDNVHVAVGDWQPDVRILSAVANLVDAEIDGVRRRYRVAVNGSVHYVDSALGSSALREVPRFPDPSSIQEPGSLLAPMPGVVVRVEVTEGDAVNAGTVIMVLEAMKMEHTVRSPAEGVVTSISVKSSEQVDAGQVLAVVGENSGDAS
ncbi:biotin carboxylase N-terminal domain-containing protein [Mycobacteroides abscessus]|uniref:acetyl/propionyl/methylcrotonyl-CoA carboxylase subunit alpha n=1 Tax=Mycobacteroides abscessus TaxID=36809 RepID=UPI0009277950|nr:biotin carboxylase N-terminal domain-containing protein [Mycobacteroides abscessus]MDM2014620.1 biotin carboxylase N-terminal domain-containing protein [Mycobacteroides abscessus]MDM2020261.1 biotin carboxylase N-terminal domain-containing protein [Mycobacteroides abscessus]MDM2023908.1 biotin carboxylase N-terminal domain-containing protein [Mycobacteroides abscessus]MDM2028821.1 biotin carboxylase N-terminal domain-containing protein [Mycobacteroides abscessus]MDM2032858.1 biotin carboxyl